MVKHNWQVVVLRVVCTTLHKLRPCVRALGSSRLLVWLELHPQSASEAACDGGRRAASDFVARTSV